MRFGEWRDVSGPEETEGWEAGRGRWVPEDAGRGRGSRGETGRVRGGQWQTAGDRERQGEAGGDAWQCSFLSAVALAVTHWSLGCYIYQAAVWCSEKTRRAQRQVNMWHTSSINTTRVNYYGFFSVEPAAKHRRRRDGYPNFHT